MSTLKNLRGEGNVHVYRFEQGGFCPGMGMGILSYTLCCWVECLLFVHPSIILYICFSFYVIHVMSLTTLERRHFS